MRMTASYRKASSCIQRRNRKQEGKENTRFWPLGAHSDETAKKRSEVAVARSPPMVSMPGKRMGYCCFGASLPMRITASWSRIRQDPPHTRMWRLVLTNPPSTESGLHLVSLLFLSQVIRTPPPPLGSIGIGLTVATPAAPRSDLGCRRAQANQGQALRVAAEKRPSLDEPCARAAEGTQRSGRKNARGAGRTKEWINRLRRGHAL